MLIATAALLEWEEGAAGNQADNAGLSCSGQQLSPNPHWRERARRSQESRLFGMKRGNNRLGPLCLLAFLMAFVSCCLPRIAGCTGGSSGAGSGQAFSPLQLHNLKGKVTPPSIHPPVCVPGSRAPLQYLQLTKEAQGGFKL